jgi:lipopolysaccharide export system protein LptA
MKHPKNLLPFLAALAFSSAVFAEKADRNKPMNIESDALRYDDLKQSSVFTGKVVLSKGTILIRGARVDVRQDPEGYQLGLVTAEPGKQAFFRQKREGLDEFIEGEAESIEYDSRADTVKFIQNAQLRRYQGAKLNDEMSGAVILYNNTTEVFSIDGAPAKTGLGTAPSRVRAMLTPKSEPIAARPAAGTPLRDSPALEGSKK